MEVGHEPVAGTDGLGEAVGAVGHLPHPGAIAGADGPLPPGGGGLALVGLGVEVEVGDRGDVLEPHEPPGAVDDHDPGWPGAGPLYGLVASMMKRGEVAWLPCSR